jgi:hypothetical protein
LNKKHPKSEKTYRTHRGNIKWLNRPSILRRSIIKTLLRPTKPLPTTIIKLPISIPRASTTRQKLTRPQRTNIAMPRTNTPPLHTGTRTNSLGEATGHPQWVAGSSGGAGTP